MKFFIVLSAVLAAATALPTRSPPVVIGEDNLLLSNGSLSFDGRNAGLAGFAHGNVGGAGGSVWTVWDAWALRDALNSAERRIIYVRGRIDLTTLFTGSPGVVLHVGPYKSIIGGDANAMIFGGSLRLTNQVHVIIQNIKFHNCISYAPGEQPNGNGGIISQVSGAWSSIDNVDINESEFIWVDHCEFADDPWNAANTPENQRRHNGLLTIKNRSSHISVSNNIFRNHNMNFLIGHDDSATSDIGRLRVTIYLNWFRGVIQRSPRVRYGEVHVLNNLYTDISSYGVGVGTGARVYCERNVFRNVLRSWHNIGTGALLDYNNVRHNSGFDSGISGSVGWVPTQYYGYTPMGNHLVEAHVMRYAGTI